jgi:transposase-like protein
MSTEAERIRAALLLRKTSVSQIARKHGVSDKTCYAVLAGNRPGREPGVKKAIAEMRRITAAVFGPKI